MLLLKIEDKRSVFMEPTFFLYFAADCFMKKKNCPLLSLQGVKRCSPITGCEEFYYPPWKRALFRWLVSLPICLLCLCFVFLAMLLCLELQVWTDNKVSKRQR